MKDTIKTAMKTALADMGVSQDKYQALEFSVKSLQEIRENDVAICKETTVTIKIVKIWESLNGFIRKNPDAI